MAATRPSSARRCAKGFTCLFPPGPDQDPVCPLVSLYPLTHTDTGWERVKALPQTTQLDGHSLHSHPGLSVSKLVSPTTVPCQDAANLC